MRQEIQMAPKLNHTGPLTPKGFPTDIFASEFAFVSIKALQALTWIERQWELNWRFRHIYSLASWQNMIYDELVCVQ